jgi:CelD/BcsL family acetyltransferase involved in cellulose biosynthesis
MRSADGFTIRHVDRSDEFMGLAPVWADFVRASGQVSPFLSHDWFACCWPAVESVRAPEILVVEEADTPVAIIPMMRWRERRHGLPVRCLGFLECPDSPFMEMLCVGEPERAIRALVEHLAAQPGWDVLRLGKLTEGSATVKAFERALVGQLAWRRGGTERSPYLALAGTWETFFRGKTQRFRKTIRNMENRLGRAGAVRVEEHREVDPEGPILAEIMEVSRQSWKGPQGLAMATMAGMPGFFRELTSRASANGWLHLWILRLNGRAIATEYQLGANGCRYALRADFDPALADLSPGAYLNAYIIRSLFDRGDVQEYDMGPGSNEYKLRWATGNHETVTLEAYAPTPYGHFLHQIETRLVPFARRWRDQFSRKSSNVRKFGDSSGHNRSTARLLPWNRRS